jgi:hypothetical protein
MPCDGAVRPEENRDCLSLFFVGSTEFEDPERIFADQEAIFFDEKNGSFEACAVGSIDLVLGLADSFLVKMEQGVMKTHPDVAIDRVDAESGKDRVERRRFGTLRLAINLFTSGAALGPGTKPGKLEIDTGIAETVVLADTWLREIGVTVVDTARGVRGEASEAEIAIEVCAGREILWLAEIANEASVGTEDRNQASIPEGSDSNLSIRQSNDGERRGDGNRAEEFAIRCEHADQIETAICNIDISLGIDVTVFAK